jgi:tagatose 1,6-diphosphate aldolase
MTELSAGKLWGLRRLADETGLFRIVSIDRRRSQGPGPEEAAGTAERAAVEALGPACSTLLLDPARGYPAAADALPPRRGLLLALEDHRFEETPKGRKAHLVEGWSVAKAKRLGADGVSVAVHVRADAGRETGEHQKRIVRAVGEACRRFDLPFLLSPLPYPLGPAVGGAPGPSDDPAEGVRLLAEAVRIFAAPEYGVDLFALELPPLPEPPPDGAEAADEAEAARVRGLFDEAGKAAGRPWVLRSSPAAPREAFARALRHALGAGASGFLADPAAWLEEAGSDGDDAVAAHLDAINALARERATPWHRHPCHGGAPRLRHAGPGFPKAYESL